MESLSQNYAAVKLFPPARRKKYQALQLQRHAPDLYRRVLLGKMSPAQGLKILMDRLLNPQPEPELLPPATQVEIVKQLIEAQPIIRPGQMIDVPGTEFELRRMPNDDLRLFRGASSWYVGYWGRDDSVVSTDFAGKWKVGSNFAENMSKAGQNG